MYRSGCLHGLPTQVVTRGWFLRNEGVKLHQEPVDQLDTLKSIDMAARRRVFRVTNWVTTAANNDGQPWTMTDRLRRSSGEKQQLCRS